MRALLDTNTFLWAIGDDPRLPLSAKTVIKAGANEIFLSAVSVWEISIKYSNGRLDLGEPPDRFVVDRIRFLRLNTLDIGVVHATKAAELPWIHRDPFDRLLVAQSQIEGLPIITSDRQIAAYGVEIIW